MTVSGSHAVLPAAEAYRLWAPGYDSTPNPLLSLEERHLAPLLLSAAGGDVVDLGCGTGRWLERLEVAQARSLVGVDSSQAMLHHAAKKVSRTRLICTQCYDTTLPPNSSDVILASFLLSYLDNIDRLAAEIARICRQGGFVFASDVHPTAAARGWRRTFESLGEVFEIETRPYPLAALHRAMAEHGLALSQCNEVSFGEEEHAIFTQAGRPDLFAAAGTAPAIFIATYRRAGA